MAKRAFIRKGDRTTHGGEVLSGDPTFFIHGREVARVGDSVSCPRCKRISRIVTGAPTCFSAQMLALHDDVTDCGAKLIASQFTDTYDDGSEDSATLASLPLASGVSESNQAEDDELHSIRFQAIDPDTGQSAAKCVYILTRENGVQHGGLTDAEGFTETIETAKPEQIAVHFMFKSPKGDNIEREKLTA